MSSENDDYPYVSTFITAKEAESIFNAIKYYKVDIIEVNKYKVNHLDIDTKFMDKYLMIDTKRNSEYRNYNVIVDWFSEYARCRSKRFDQSESPHEYWLKYRDILRTKCRTRIGTVTNEGLNLLIYEKTRQCICMRPTVIKAFYRLFEPTRILDPFCGFGSSLITAMACEINFVGCDPNSNLIKPYKHMIQVLKADDIECVVIHKPFEDASVEGSFDMIFTSPPFYDVEVYNHEDTQSIAKYKSEPEWYAQFLLPSIKKAWDLLRSSGTMIIYMTNVYDSSAKKIKYGSTERLISHISQWSDATYLGCISFGDIISRSEIDRIQPLFVWRKI